MVHLVKGEAGYLGSARRDFTCISVQVFEIVISKYVAIVTQPPHPQHHSILCIKGNFRLSFAFNFVMKARASKCEMHYGHTLMLNEHK